MNALRCLRAVARPATLLKPSIAQQARNMSLLNARRPMLSASSMPSTLAAPGAPSSALTSSSETLDIMGKISASPAFAGVQIRCGPRDTYNPSHFVRKRRHGFLSRLRSKKGRKLLMRRLTRGRWNLSH
ncbi:50S ribosomal protein L34 [Stagonosporopsis vannaccii]|nr:50S ribosomal protein L34 [Stagonosporopsis vannaccii]